MDDQVPEKVTINGEELDASEASELISYGRKTKEYEQKWNTPLDNVWPEYGKSRETVKQLETELQNAKNQLESFQQKQEAGTDTPNDLAKAKAAARELGLTFQEDLEKGEFVKKSDLDKYYDERQAKQDATNRILSEAERLSKEIDGSDGRPKFNKKVVLAYASAYGIADLQKAYEEMHDEQVKAWKDAQVKAQQKPGLKTLTASQGNKLPKEVKVNDDNVNSLLREKLYGAQE